MKYIPNTSILTRCWNSSRHQKYAGLAWVKLVPRIRENRKSQARDTKEEEEVQNGEDRLSTLCVKEKHSTSTPPPPVLWPDNGGHTGCPLPHTGMVWYTNKQGNLKSSSLQEPCTNQVCTTYNQTRWHTNRLTNRHRQTNSQKWTYKPTHTQTDKDQRIHLPIWAIANLKYINVCNVFKENSSTYPDICTQEHFRIVTHSLQTAWSGDTLPCRVPWTADRPVRIYDACAVHSQLVGVLSLYFQIQKLCTMHISYKVYALLQMHYHYSLDLDIVPWTIGQCVFTMHIQYTFNWLVFFIFSNTMHNAYFLQGLYIVALSLFTRLLVPITFGTWVFIH